MRRRLLACLAAIAAIVSQASAQLQCGRTWMAAPNGVFMTDPDVDSFVSAMTSWDPDGAGPQPPVLVVAGHFEWAGGAQCNNIAYFDGIAWHPLALGLTGTVYSLAVLNNQLYAGGDFTGSGITTLHNLARWTGSAWTDVGGGTDGTVNVLLANGSELFVGGSFLHVNGSAITAHFGASYTGAGWTAYSGFAGGPVVRAVIFNGTPYVISWNSSPPSHYILAHIQSGAWTGLTGLDRSVGGMTVYQGALFYMAMEGQPGNPACGPFEEYAIKRFDGNSTTTVARCDLATDFVQHNGQFYAVGTNRVFCLSAVGNHTGIPWTGRWDGTTFVPAPFAIAPGSLLCSANGTLYTGGSFSNNGVNGLQCSNVARLAGGNIFEPVPDSFDGIARCATAIGTSFYVGGDFSNFGATSLGHLGVFNGTTWSSVGQINGPVNAISYYSPNPQSIIGSGVIVSGGFTTINGTAFNRIARRDSQSGNWIALGTGLNAPALAFIPYNTTQFHNDFIVGGQFTSAGGVSANYIARWTGTAWQAMSTGMNAEVRTLAGYNGVFYAGGYFTTASGLTCNFIAQWNGSFWAPVGGGMNDVVRALAVYNGKLYAAGDFTVAGGVPANHIAAWNGAAWTAAGDGLDGSVLSLVNSGTTLIAGGFFTHSGTTSCNHIAQWTDAAWDSVGGNFYTSSNGVDGNVIGMAVSSGGDLIVAGQMAHACGQPSTYVARAVVPTHLTARIQPVGTSTCPGGSATLFFGIRSSFSAPTTFRWYRNGVALSDGTTPAGTIFSGATTWTLSIDNARVVDAGDFWCTVDNTCGEHLTSNTAALTIGGPTCPSPCGSADYNCDGDLGTDSDIAAFFSCLSGSCPPPPCTSNADFNGDGDLGTDSDIEAFFRVLGGGTC